MADVPIETVNFHLWQPCNMRCRFCFATFRDVRESVLPSGHLPRETAERLVLALGAAGFKKITFAGGEPLLCPWIHNLVRLGSEIGLTTSLVTNGSLLDEPTVAGFKGSLDWVAISIDSLNPETLRATGRVTRGRPLDQHYYLNLCERLRHAGFKLKVNTVVTAENWTEDLSEFITAASPRRWKIFQVLPVRGQNLDHVEPLLVTEEQFTAFVDRHREVEHRGISVIPETNETMTGSYAMIDPAGRFYDAVEGGYTYSDPVLDVGVATALSQVRVSREKFIARGGLYAG